MKVTCISHACLLIDTGSFLIATDPWFDGPAFCDQWHVFPKPIDTEPVATAPVAVPSRKCSEGTLFGADGWLVQATNKFC